jgi:hypothetical protein
MTARMGVVVAWEGEATQQADVDALKRLRAELSGVRWIHMVDPASFLRGDTSQAKAYVREATTGEDIFGIHLAGWKSLMDKAGVPFRAKPTFFGNVIAKEDCAVDCGREVPLSAYSQDELRRFLGSAVAVYRSGTGHDPESFLVAGHVATRAVVLPAREMGLEHDFSGVVPAQMAEALSGYPLSHWVKSAWPSARADRPVFFEMLNGRRLTRYVVNGGQVDWASSETLAEQAWAVVADARARRASECVVIWMLHEATAAKYAPRLLKAMSLFRGRLAAAGVTIAPMALKE